MNSGRFARLKRRESGLSRFRPNNPIEERAGSTRVSAVAMIGMHVLVPSVLVAPGLMANTSAESACSSCELVSISTSTCSASASPANKSQTNNTPHADSVECR